MRFRPRPLVLALALAFATAALPERAVARTAVMTFSLPADADETDQMIVRFKPGRGTTRAGGPPEALPSAATLSRQAGLDMVARRSMGGGAQVYRLTAGKKRLAEVRAAARRLMAQNPDVLYAEPDARMFPLSVPNDARYGEMWHLHAPTATGNPATTSEGSANLPGAWAITTGRPTLVIGVIDTGILPNHQDLLGRTVAGYDFISTATVANDGDGRDGDPTDPGDCTNNATCSSSWHGTHVAGTIGAAANNGQGIAGINWQSKIQALRVLGVGGGYTSDIADAIRWGAGAPTMDGSNPWPQGANPTPARVLNLSLGGSGVCNTTTQEAIDTAVGLGTVVVVAAGNENQSLAEVPKQPATCNGIIPSLPPRATAAGPPTATTTATAAITSPSPRRAAIRMRCMERMVSVAFFRPSMAARPRH